MTEATPHYFTPLLVHLSNQQDPEEKIRQLLVEKFGETPPSQISWINKEKLTFTIDMVRELTQSLSYASLQGKTRHVILIAIDHATTEAQNALLKMLEEPPTRTQIWLTAEHQAKLLPTIISRCQEVLLDGHAESKQTPEEVAELAQKIASLSYRELSEVAEKNSEREEAKQLIENLTLYFHLQLEKSAEAQYTACLKTLLQTSQYLEANVNTRLALEHCFFNLKKELSQKRDH